MSASLTRSPHITQRSLPTPPLCSNPSWIHPESGNPVTIYEMTLRGTLSESKGYWDSSSSTWRKVNGQVAIILGWK